MIRSQQVEDEPVRRSSAHSPVLRYIYIYVCTYHTTVTNVKLFWQERNKEGRIKKLLLLVQQRSHKKIGTKAGNVSAARVSLPRFCVQATCCAMKLPLHLRNVLVRVATLLLASSVAQTFNEGKFNSLIAKLEEDVLDFAREIERFYATRCQDIRFGQCSQGNYDDCQAVYPSQQCLPGESYHVPVCGDSLPDGTGCSGLIDFSVSTVRIPSELTPARNSNPTDPQVIETVCYTQAMENWLQAKRAADREYWNELGVEPWAWYFGSHTGVFRFWPGRQGATCGQYDPRVRPWYVAASSGPKNVIMVLDTSGSMAGLRMQLLKEAAKRVVNTLTVADRVAIVPFATVANNPITDAEGNMFMATQANKQILLDEIDRLEARGRTNIFGALLYCICVLLIDLDTTRTHILVG